MIEKPRLKLVGMDGNAFNILAVARMTARKAGWSEELVNKFLFEARSGNYDHLLQTCMKYFEVS